MPYANNADQLLTSPALSEDFGLRGKEKSERKYSQVVATFLALAKPTLKLVSGIGMTSAASTAVSGYELFSLGPSVSGGVGVVAGGLAYAFHRYANSLEPQFNKMLSDNVYKDIAQKHDYEMRSEDIDPSKVYTQKVIKECSRRNTRLMLHKAGTIPRKVYEAGKLAVDKFIGQEHERLYLGYQHNDSDLRSLFIAHVMGELENNNDPVAQRIKQEPAFNRESIKAFMQDSGKMVKSLSDVLPDIASLGKVLEKSLGPDARFLLKNLDDYSKGRESYFALELDVLEHAAKQSQVEGVTREFSARLVHTMMDAVNGNIEDVQHERSRFDEFKSLFGRYDNNSQLTTLATSGVKLAEQLIDKIDKTGGRRAAAQLNLTLKTMGLTSEAIHFRSMKKGTPEYTRAIDVIMRAYLGKDYDVTRSFQEQMVQSTLTVLEKRVKEKAKIDFPSAESIEKLAVERLDMAKIHHRDPDVFHEHLASLSDSPYRHSDNHYNKGETSLIKLAQKMRQYGIRSLESATPDDAAKQVFDRIQTRLYYETFKPEMKNAAKRSGLDAKEFDLSM